MIAGLMREETQGWWARCPHSAADGTNQCQWDAYVYEVYVVDGETYAMVKLDALYIGRGSRDIEFRSDNADNPARFFYEAMGGARSAEREEKIWGELLPEFAYGWATLDITAGAARA